jgi:hypothetical protein
MCEKGWDISVFGEMADEPMIAASFGRPYMPYQVKE